MKTVTAVDASLNFLSLLRDVERGETIAIISNGRAVAALSPLSAPRSATEVAKIRLLQRLRSQNRTGVQAWSRDKFYDV